MDKNSPAVSALVLVAVLTGALLLGLKFMGTIFQRAQNEDVPASVDRDWAKHRTE